jgi:ATPase subunit of ABC transporter with duplicated ATPase domains
MLGIDKDYVGDVRYKKGLVVVNTLQEYDNIPKMTIIDYVLSGIPEYRRLSNIINHYPDTMGDNMKMIEEYSSAIQEFADRDFYDIENRINQTLDKFGLGNLGDQSFNSLSGGQKRLVEVVKVMNSDAQLALVDEPTNHMDYVAKEQFIDWMKEFKKSIFVITHDRDVLNNVDRIVELRDKHLTSFNGQYNDYLKQNAVSTNTSMTSFSLNERRKANLESKVIQFRRYKEKARDPGTIRQFKRRENEAIDELRILKEKEKPSFWIDKESVGAMNYKATALYDKLKDKNIKINTNSAIAETSSRNLLSVRNLSLGYDHAIFKGLNFDVHENESIEIRGRNGAGKSTLLNFIFKVNSDNIDCYDGEVKLDKSIRFGIYFQETPTYLLNLTLSHAVEEIYKRKNVDIFDRGVRKVLSDYLFTEEDMATPVSQLSGGQKARLQIISMLANSPSLLVLDEPTNHLDLPSIEELETALHKYHGAILYVSHDGYFRKKMNSNVVEV